VVNFSDLSYEYEHGRRNRHYLVEPMNFTLDERGPSKMWRLGKDTFEHWQQNSHLLLVYQAGVGCNAVIPVSKVMPGHNLRLSRCRSTAVSLGLRLCHADMSSSYHCASWAFGLEVPAQRFEEVVATIRNEQAAWWIRREDIEMARLAHEGCWDKKICPNYSLALSEPRNPNNRQWVCRQCDVTLESGCIFLSSPVGDYIVEELDKLLS